MTQRRWICISLCNTGSPIRKSSSRWRPTRLLEGGRLVSRGGSSSPRGIGLSLRGWEADSIDTLRGYLDPATHGLSENTYSRSTRCARWALRRLLPPAPSRASARTRSDPKLGALFLAALVGPADARTCSSCSAREAGAPASMQAVLLLARACDTLTARTPLGGAGAIALTRLVVPRIQARKPLAESGELRRLLRRASGFLRTARLPLRTVQQQSSGSCFKRKRSRHRSLLLSPLRQRAPHHGAVARLLLSRQNRRPARRCSNVRPRHEFSSAIPCLGSGSTRAAP